MNAASIGAGSRAQREQTLRRAVLVDKVRERLAEPGPAVEVLGRCLEAIGHALGWEVGELWAVGRAGDVVICRARWHAEGDESLALFSEAASRYRFARGEGIAGMAWSTRKHIWVEDLLVLPQFRRRDLAVAAGIHGSCTVPILAWGEVVGVIAFACRERRSEDPEQLAALRDVADLLGQSVARWSTLEALQDRTVRTRRLVDGLEEVVFEIDRAGRWSYLNAGFARATGRSAEGRIGAAAEADFDEASSGVFRGAVQDVLDGRAGEARVDVALATADGPRWMEASLQALAGAAGGTEGVLGILVDQTRRRREEEALRAAKDAAVRATEAKSAFLANMSHEIRTPLNGVIGMLSLAMRTRLDPQQREYVETAHASAVTLLHILSDILDLSKIEAGRLDLEVVPFPLRATLERVSRPVAARAEQKGIRFEVEVDEAIPDVLVGDPTRIGQVVNNLLSNAVRFTERGSVRLRVGGMAVRPGIQELAISVQDTGIGIARDRIAAIFEPFSQADGSITRRFGGTGLGLAICRQLAERMGACVGVESEPGRGSTFTLAIRLPVAEAGALAGPVRSGPRTPAAPRRVLIAEDNAVNRLLALRILEAAGHAVTTAADGEEAVRLAASREFDVVFMDVQMPRVDGLAATARIRERERASGGHVRIVALTAQAMSGDRDRCLAAGADDYLSKPFTADALEDVVAGQDRPAVVPTRSVEPDAGPLESCRTCRNLAFEDCERREARAAFDRGAALSACGEDESLRREVTAEFLRALPDERAALRSAVAGGDLVGAARVAHRLKSTLGAVGATPAGDAAASLERAAKEGAPSAAALEARLSLELDRAAEALAASIREGAPA